MKKVTRDEFGAYIRANPELIGRPVVGTTVAVMQYTTADHKVKAYVEYRKAPGQPCYTSYYINTEDQPDD